jgi:hypothetical protein
LPLPRAVNGVAPGFQSLNEPATETLQALGTFSSKRTVRRAAWAWAGWGGLACRATLGAAAEGRGRIGMTGFGVVLVGLLVWFIFLFLVTDELGL